MQEVKDHGVAMLKTQLAESESIFGPYLRLYQIHSAAPETRVLENAEVLDELRRLRERGLFLGVTATGLRQLETIRKAMEIRADGLPLFSTVQATFNLLERSAGPGFPGLRAAESAASPCAVAVFACATRTVARVTLAKSFSTAMPSGPLS